VVSWPGVSYSAWTRNNKGDTATARALPEQMEQERKNLALLLVYPPVFYVPLLDDPS
jgi:hypothetical protein